MSVSNESFPVFDPPTGDSATSEPSQAADSYFPSSHRSSFSSNNSSVAAEPGTIRLRPAQPSQAITSTRPTSSSQKAVPLDALSRAYPKPAHEPSLEEMLARPPQKWSVGHYVKNARETKAPAVDKQEQAKAFADAKKELLAAKAALERMSPAVD